MNRHPDISYQGAIRSATLFLLLAVYIAVGLSPVSAQNKPGEGGKITLDDKPEKKGKKTDAKEDPARPLPAQVTGQIMKLAVSEKKKRMDFMYVVIEDVTRLCKLDDKQQDRLNLAAKGSAERSMKKWHTQAENYYKTRLKNQDKDGIKKILAAMGTPSFSGRNIDKDTESQELWKETLKEVLSDEQVKQYEEVVKIRKEEKVRAFAQMSLATLSDFLRLTPDQKEEMEKVVEQSATDFFDAMHRYWPDYYQKGMLMSLANGVENEELMKFLSKRQLDRHNTATADFNHFWDQKRKEQKSKIKAAAIRKEKAAVKDAAAKKDD